MPFSDAEKARRYRERHPERLREIARKSYRKNREKAIARTKAWQKRNPEKVRDYQENRRVHKPHLNRAGVLRRKYKMTPEQHAAMFEAQGRRCAACGSTKPNAKHWHTDHCHETGVVRGILCQNCNVGLGHAKHDPDILHLWLRYLRISSVLY